MIKNTLKKMISVGLAAVVAGSLMVGCGSSSSKSADASDPSKLKEVKLKMYILGDRPKDFDQVYGKVNEIMKKKINATLDVNFVPWSDVNTKYQLLFQSGEDFDLMFTATGWAYYSQVATKNGFYELTDDMLKKYAPNVYENEPKEAWEQAKVNNKIYMVPCDKVEFNNGVFGVRGDLMKKYGIDKITNIADFEKYMDAASKDKSLKAVMANGGGQNLQFPYLLEKNGFDIVRGTSQPLIDYSIEDKSGKIVSIVDTPQYLEYVKKMREFEQKGYWAADSISSKATRDDDFVAGNTATMVWNVETVSLRAQKMNKLHPDWQAQVVDTTNGQKKVPNAYVNNGIGINAISKNPERALMAIDLLRYDKDIYDLTWFGVKGTHWEDAGDGKYKTLDATANYPALSVCPWGWYSEKYHRVDAEQPAIVKEINDKWLKSDKVDNALTAFSFDDSKVKNEMAAVGNVVTQYGVPLDLGMVEDIEAGVKQYREKLSQAGYDKILEECQKQTTEYMKKHNK